MEWEPIETAPKDGTPILAARFKNKGNGGWTFAVIRWRHYGFQQIDQWHSLIAINGRTDAKWNPTHWMPLPAPPAKATASEGAA